MAGCRAPRNPLPRRPLVGFRGAAGTATPRTRTAMGSVRPVRRFDALRGFVLGGVHPAEAGGSPPCAFAPLQRRACSARHHAVARPPAEAGARPVTRCCLSWALAPYDTCRADGPASLTAGPPAAACHVRGFDPPRGSHHRPSRRRSAGASLGFTLQGVPLACGRYPSRGPCPPDVAAARASRGRSAERGRLQGLVPAASPS